MGPNQDEKQKLEPHCDVSVFHDPFCQRRTVLTIMRVLGKAYSQAAVSGGSDLTRKHAQSVRQRENRMLSTYTNIAFLNCGILNKKGNSFYF